MRRLATACYRHRWRVVAIWLGALVLFTVLARIAGTDYASSFTLPDTDSRHALALLQSATPAQAGDRDQVVVATRGGGRVTDPAARASVEAMLARVATLPHVARVDSPYAAGRGSTQVSPDGTIAFATVTFDVRSRDVTVDQAKQFVATAQTAARPDLQVGVTGQVAQRAEGLPIGGVWIGILAAAIVLFLVFGSLLSMLLPLVTTLVALGTAVGLITLLTHVLDMPDFSSQLVLLIGLGVGVDYALFIVTRHRQGLLSGHDVEESVVTAVNTSGRAVVFAGITVCIALLGMLALGVSFLYGAAVAASIGVLFTMVGAVTLLPALLGFLGPRVLSRRQRRRLAAGELLHDVETRGWQRHAARLQRAPAVAAVVTGALVVLLAVPMFSLRLGSSDQGNDPKGSTTRTGYDLLAQGFGPGFNGPLQLTAAYRGSQDDAVLARLAAGTAAEHDLVAAVSPPLLLPTGQPRVALIQVYPRSAPQDAATGTLLHRLRGIVIPSAVAGSDLRVYVGGDTAIFEDFASVLGSKLPLFVGVVVLLSFLLLMVVLRSLLVPLTAALMNLLSVGAAFGVVTAVFQWGWLDRVIGVDRTGPIEAFVPVMLFSVLFGLSMDYEVFLVTRVHEEWLHRRSNAPAVTHALAVTGRTITAAASIMVVVFAAFILGGERVIKMFGLGLAAAIAVDAVVIRSVLVPAVMLLCGRANWWFPKRLDRVLPRVSVEPPESAAVVVADPDEQVLV